MKHLTGRPVKCVRTVLFIPTAGKSCETPLKFTPSLREKAAVLSTEVINEVEQQDTNMTEVEILQKIIKKIGQNLIISN